MFSLAGWCRQIHTGFLRSRATQDARRPRPHSGYGALTPFGPPSQDGSPMRPSAMMRVLQPRRRLDAGGLGPSPFAHHYLGNHCCFLLLRVLRCFSSPGSPPRAYVFGPWIRLRVGFPIRNRGSQRPFASRTALSGLGPSFVAGRCLGIPRVHSCASFLFPTIQLNLLCMSSSNPHRGASNFSRSIAYSWFSSAVMSICGIRLADAICARGRHWS